MRQAKLRSERDKLAEELSSAQTSHASSAAHEKLRTQEVGVPHAASPRVRLALSPTHH